MDKDGNENETINRKPIFPQGEDRKMLESIDGQAIGIGKSQFRSLRAYDCYYVDKTALIDRVLKARYDVFLFTRPRRFGKTLNLSMLDEYLGIQHADEPDIFEGLEIERLRPNDPEKNSNPVIRLSLKDMRSRDYPHFIRNMGQKMSALCKDYRGILDSDSLDEDDAALFRRIKSLNASEDDLRYSLLSLTRMFHDAYGKPVILLIDEYDNILNETETDSLRTEILGFMSDFLSSVLKDNEYLRFAVLTGIAQIAKASIFSGLNNLYTDNVFDSRFGEFWGFTEDEVKQICRDFGDEARFEEAKEWYDGYRFGKMEAYNPWSVLNYVDRGFVPDTYWANNSRNTILNRMFLGMDDNNFLQMIELLSGGSFKAELQTSLTYHEAHNDRNALYSLMAMTGYLRVEHVEGETYRLSFPDKEVMDLMEWTARSIMVPQGTAWFRDFCTAVLEGRTDDMEDVLGKVLVQNSYWDLTDERSYKLVITTILTGIWRYYRVRSEQEGGNGRIDILMESRKPGRANIIFELKKADSEADLEPEAKKGLEQIHEKRYYLGMEGTVLLYGISFWGKVPCMEHERIELPLFRTDPSRSCREERRTTPYIP